MVNDFLFIRTQARIKKKSVQSYFVEDIIGMWGDEGKRKGNVKTIADGERKTNVFFLSLVWFLQEVFFLVLSSLTWIILKAV